MRIISIHGFNASPQMNYHSWLKSQLEDLGHEVLTPELSLSTKEEIVVTDIIQEMKQQVGYLRNEDIVIGHSLGALLVLQYLEAVEMTETPRAVVLVAAPWRVDNPDLRRLFIADLDAEVVMWKARQFVVVHSKDDNLVPFKHGEKLAKKLKATLVTSETDGHFMNEQHPVLLKAIKKIIDTPFEYAPGMSLDDDYQDVETLL